VVYTTQWLGCLVFTQETRDQTPAAELLEIFLFLLMLRPIFKNATFAANNASALQRESCLLQKPI